MLNRLKGVFKSLQQHNVKYVVIGGIAAVLYGGPRATFDFDLFTFRDKGSAYSRFHAAWLTSASILCPISLSAIARSYLV